MFSRLSSAYELAVIKSAAQSGEVEVKGFLGRYNETTPDGQDTNKYESCLLFFTNDGM